MRRLWLASILACWALGAGAAEFVKPVQLSLDFTAAPAAALPLSLALPVPQSFYTGDPATYLAELRATGYVPPVSDDAQHALLREGLEREAADRAFFAQRTVQSSAPAPRAAAPGRATKIDYDVFARRVDRLSGLSLNIFQDVDAKREILRDSGYTHLTGAGGVRIPIASASAARVGKAFAHAHRALQNRRKR